MPCKTYDSLVEVQPWEEPYSGKVNVRFDEGELEIELCDYYASSLLYCS